MFVCVCVAQASMHACEHTWIQTVAICKYIIVYISNVSDICCINCISFNFVLPKLHFEAPKLDIKRFGFSLCFTVFFKGLQIPDQLSRLSSPIFNDKFLAVRLGGILRAEVNDFQPWTHAAKQREKTIRFKWDSDTPDWYRVWIYVVHLLLECRYQHQFWFVLINQ